MDATLADTVGLPAVVNAVSPIYSVNYFLAFKILSLQLSLIVGATYQSSIYSRCHLLVY